jgi:hypothetical protein
MVNLQETKKAVMAVTAVVVIAVAVAAVIAPTRNADVPIGEKGEVPSAPPKHESCPKSCMCPPRHTDKFSAIDVQCGDQNLSSVPTITENDIPIYVLNLSSNSLNNLTLRGYQSATYLYLQHCKIYTIDEEAFHGFENLTFVDLSNNLLKSIPPNLFADNLSLYTLILRSNDLQDIDPNTPFLNGPASLKTLILQDCKLSTLSSATFASLPNLRNLDISRNKLLFLDSEYLHSLRKLEDIIVDSNPWKCGAKFEDLLCWIQRKPVAFNNETLSCQHDNKTSETWPPDKRTSFCSGTTPSLSQVYKPDVTETTIVNPGVLCPQEIGNSWWWQPYLIGMCGGISVALCKCVLSFCFRVLMFIKTRSSLRHSELHSEETHIASEDSEEREQESKKQRKKKKKKTTTNIFTRCR